MNRAVDPVAGIDVGRVLRDGGANLLHDLGRRDADVEDGRANWKDLEHPAMPEENHGPAPADSVVRPRAGDDAAGNGIARKAQIQVRQAWEH